MGAPIGNTNAKGSHRKGWYRSGGSKSYLKGQKLLNDIKRLNRDIYKLNRNSPKLYGRRGKFSVTKFNKGYKFY